MSQAGAIQQTTDYKVFKIKKGNRAVITNSVRRLVNSIKKHNMLSANPIIVNKKMEVIDGQHRLEAAQRLNAPIFYVVFDPASLPEIQLLNANMKVWTALDFLESYITIGKKEYIIFKEFWTKYDFPFSTTMQLLFAPNKSRTKNLHHVFKEGSFKIANIEESEVLAEKYGSILEWCHNSVKSSNRFYDAVNKLIQKYPTYFEKLLIRATGKKRIYRCESTVEYLQEFEDIINEGHKGKPIRLY